MRDLSKKRAPMRDSPDTLLTLGFFRGLKRKPTRWGIYRFATWQCILEKYYDDTDSSERPKGLRMFLM